MLICSNAHALDKEQINVGILVPINSLYPWGEIILEPIYVMENIFETLTKMKEGSIEIELCLALRIDPSPDYKIWTAYLRKNVTFHDGTPFNADAVVASLSVQGSLKNIVRKLDGYAVVFTLDKPNITFPLTLSTPYCGIGSQSTIDCFKTNCRTPVIVGTGPYKLQNWRPPSEIILSINETYWGKKPFFKKAGFLSFDGDQALLEALKNGTVHLAPTIKPKNIAVIREMPHLQFRSIQTLSICFLLMNTERKPFNDPRIRQAINISNISRWSNKKIDELLEKGRSQKDPAERLKIYQQAQRILHQEMPFVPLIYPLQTTAWHNKLKNFVPHPINRLYLQPLTLEE